MAIKKQFIKQNRFVKLPFQLRQEADAFDLILTIGIRKKGF
jgi:hypothetical protein